ncbi:NAD(P)/FAD-dependent oxidoreductase [Marivirga sp. S37H4]|uniref:NAD(P)/FAD-dependent oxidoreductase n=2 Tax=Marivirga aurantiaca TaxID=2802615 RepID=A0A934WWP2_9BACT|nr:NAD(P)/FAD-dependent oxidoreductase [Marivirga aurantiaca]
MPEYDYDIIIVGAGPAGCACAYQLRDHELKIALVDKSVFPRDKICGDALSADVVNQLYRMDEKLALEFERFPQKIDSHGIQFYAPNGNSLSVDFINPNHHNAAGYISKRMDFDAFLFKQIEKLPNVSILTGERVEDVQSNEQGVEVKVGNQVLKAQMVIGADGAQSIVNKKLGQIKVEKDHYSAGLRQYYEGVEGFHPKNYIELHFYDGVLPGYFWIFPLPNGQANVGLGMLSSEVSKRKIDLKKKLDELIHTHPNIKERFKNAQPLENIQGFGLPIGSKKRPISGNRFLLLGDAASLIDSFTGEGIGNAIRSGRIAADHLVKAFDNQCFDARFNKHYDKVVYQKMWKELRVSRALQKLLQYPKLFNFVIKKANNNSSVRILLSSMLTDVDLKKELLKPGFYLKLFFR